MWFSYISFLRIFFRKIRPKLVDKENVAVVEITITWLLEIYWSYKLVKGCWYSVEVSNSTEDLGIL